MAEQMMQDAAGKAIPAGYKQTEVGVIPHEWNVISIQNLLTEKYILDQMDGNHGELYPKSHEFSSFGVPYIGATDFSNGDVDFKGCKFISLARAKKFKKGIARNGDVLFAHNATVGPVCLLDSDFDFVILSTTATYYRCNNDLLKNKYLAKYFCSDFFVSQYKAVMSQSTRNQVPILAQRKFLIVVPSKDEQTAIANVLSDTDALIAGLEQLIAKKHAIKTATMQQLLTGRTRLPAFALRPDGTPKGYKTSELGQIPEDWITPTLKGITSNIIDYRGRTPRKLGLEWGGGNILALSAGNVKKGFIDYEAECYFGSDELYKKWMTSGDASKGDIVFTMEAPLGNVALIPNEDKYILSQRTILLKLERSKFLPTFIIQVFLSDMFQSYISESATGSTAQGIKRATFDKMFVAVPSCLEEQTAIATILSDMESELTTLEQKLAKARDVKQGMMQQLLTGRIRLPLPQEA
ncbi:restriction endonuclease subunit S [Aeromonas media]|uniref:restriction endonuclease subunit S n=1 Tax=Aeromonas media TaxID=651 RepID=UPI003D060B96